MITIINIGTNKGNIQGAELDKPFNDIRISDIRELLNDHDGFEDCDVRGWFHVNP